MSIRPLSPELPGTAPPRARWLQKHVLAQYKLNPKGIHGIPHWKRVEKLGLLLAKASGADPAVITCFAYLHDSKRENDGIDPRHGERAADFAALLHRAGLLGLNGRQLEQLRSACRYHNKKIVPGALDLTIKTCLDSDRLDLWRIWTEPSPRLLFTEAAKDRAMINYALRLLVASRSKHNSAENTCAPPTKAHMLPRRPAPRKGGAGDCRPEEAALRRIKTAESRRTKCQALLDIAAAQLLQDKIGTAEKAVRLAIELEPGVAHASLVYAQISLKKGEPRKAEEQIEKALAAHPGGYEPNLVAAVAKLHLAKLAEAEKAILTALRLKPGDPQAGIIHAGVLLKRGDTQAAEQAARKVLKAYPGDHEAALVLTAVFTGKKKYDKAEKILKERKLLPYSFQTHAELRQLLSTLRLVKENSLSSDRYTALTVKMLYGGQKTNSPLTEAGLRNVSFTDRDLAELTCEYRYLERRCLCAPEASWRSPDRERRLLIDKFSQAVNRFIPELKCAVVSSWLKATYLWTSTEKASFPIEKARLSMTRTIPAAWTKMQPEQLKTLNRLISEGAVPAGASGLVTVYRALYGYWAAALARALRKKRKLAASETASAWTTDLRIAVYMTGLNDGGKTALILQAQVPVSRVISSHLTNPALPEKEKEFIINTRKSSFKYKSETFIGTAKGKIKIISIDIIPE